jgi:hypothetical protein
MLTEEELATLESLLARARAAARVAREAGFGGIKPGDLVQLRPGADPTWECSFLLVGQVRDTGEIRGTILRPHRGGWKDAWYRYTPPEVAWIGRALFPEPTLKVRGAGYWPACPSCHNLVRKPIAKALEKHGD